jgi:hypothetical protein
MNSYTENTNSGQLWLKDLNNNTQSANILLSSVFVKYEKYGNFYKDLNTNNISNFDAFYDTILIRTNTGYAFEKIIIKDSTIEPYNQFTSYFTNNSLEIDYWFDEKNKKIYFCGFNDIIGSNLPQLNFSLFFKEFDIKKGIIENHFDSTVSLSLSSKSNLDDSNGIKENPKLTYNSDTNMFNVSFIIKNNISKLGLISINISGQPQIEIEEINSFLPFAIVDTENSSII